MLQALRHLTHLQGHCAAYESKHWKEPVCATQFSRLVSSGYTKVVGSIPGQGTYGSQPMSSPMSGAANRCLSLPLSLSFSPKSIIFLKSLKWKESNFDKGGMTESVNDATNLGRLPTRMPAAPTPARGRAVWKRAWGEVCKGARSRVHSAQRKSGGSPPHPGRGCSRARDLGVLLSFCISLTCLFYNEYGFPELH